jgi:hypothetical protein
MPPLPGKGLKCFWYDSYFAGEIVTTAVIEDQNKQLYLSAFVQTDE